MAYFSGSEFFSYWVSALFLVFTEDVSSWHHSLSGTLHLYHHTQKQECHLQQPPLHVDPVEQDAFSIEILLK